MQEKVDTELKGFWNWVKVKASTSGPGADTGFQGGGRDFLGTKLFSGIRNKIQEIGTKLTSSIKKNFVLILYFLYFSPNPGE